jgi:ketosteroid isomerase-like protein
MSEENVEIVRQMFEAFQEGLERGNPGAAFDTGTLAADAEWQTSDRMGAEAFRGREGFTEFMRRWTEDFEGWGIQLERLIDAGDDRVVGLLHQWATGEGSGVPVELNLAIVYELDAGHAIRMCNYTTEAEALEAAGLSE